LPSDRWWVITYAIAPAIDEVNITFALLQNRSLFISQQAQYIEELQSKLTEMFNIETDDVGGEDNRNDATAMLTSATRALQLSLSLIA